MKNRKFTVLALVLSFAFILAACGNNKPNDANSSEDTNASSQASESQEASNTEEKYPAGYTLRVGMNCGAAPFNWTQDDDSYNGYPIDGTKQFVAGYDVEMARRICDANGWKLQVIKTDWDGMIPGVVSGKLDCCISTLGVTKERLQSVDFSHYYWNNGCVMVVRKDSKYANATSLEDFDGAKVTTELVSIWMPLVDQIPNVDKQPGLSDMSQLLVGVSSGKLDAIITGLTEAQSGCMSNPDLTYVTFEEGKGFDVELSALCAAIPIQKGNTELIEKCNKVIDTLSDQDKLDIMTKALNSQPLSDGSDAEAIQASETESYNDEH